MPFSGKVDFDFLEYRHQEFYNYLKLQAKTHIKLVKLLFYKQAKDLLCTHNINLYPALNQQVNLLLQLQKALYKSCNLEALSFENKGQNLVQAKCINQFNYSPPKAPKLRSRRISLRA